MDNEIKKELRDYDNYVKLLNNRSEISKNNFIKELNKGLGDEIKEKIKLNKSNKNNKIKMLFRKIFKIF